MLIDAARPVMGDMVSPELNRCQIEVASSVCTTVDELRIELVRLRRDLAKASDSVDSAILATGTHPFSSWEDQQVNTAIERYERMERRYEVVARQQVICGCHVHVGIEEPELAIQVMNRSRVWLPALLALSANSPFWHGVDTGFASYRTQVWQRWPTSGIPPDMADRAHYDALIDELRTIDAVEDETYVYWYVRPSARYPTVEFRPCDVCLDVEDTLAIAALVRALAWTCAREALRGDAPFVRSVEGMNAAMWRAARYGIDGRLVDARAHSTHSVVAAVEAFFTHVRDALDERGDTEFVADRVRHILRRGTGATDQRRARDAAQGDLRSVVDMLVTRTSTL
jgi:carboxylate-amine ligase